MAPADRRPTRVATEGSIRALSIAAGAVPFATGLRGAAILPGRPRPGLGLPNAPIAARRRPDARSQDAILATGRSQDAGGEHGSTARERRRVPRFSPDQLSEPVFVVGSRLVTVGALGLMLEAPVPLPADAPLRIHLVVSGLKAEVDVRVRSCVPRAKGPARWGLGVEFERISPDARERLERALVTARGGTA